jgi:cobaltochelatase CobT
MKDNNPLTKAAKTLALNEDLYVVMSEDKKDIAIIRGEADYLAFFDKYHLKATQLKLFREIENESFREALEKCEWARIQAIACLKYAGVRSNLNKALDLYCLNQGYNKLKDPFSLPLAELLAILLRCKLSNSHLPKSLEKLYQKVPLDIINKTTSHLPALSKQLLNQYEFGFKALKLLEELKISSEKPDPSSRQKTTSELTPEVEEKLPGEKSETDENIEKRPSTEQQDIVPKKIEADTPKLRLAGTQYSLAPSSYKVFTTEYDEVVHARKLIKDEEALSLKFMFTRKAKPYPTKALASAQKLTRLLQSQQKIKWKYDQESGFFDSRQVAKLITGQNHGLFKEYDFIQAANTAITLLVDNSGSMRGKHILMAAMSTKLLLNILEKNQVKLEVLGFTTVEWRGGESYKKWQTNGSPLNPGRLNDLRHIIYKSFNEGLLKADSNINIMLKENLLKENIDGEALLWAYRRISRQPERRKILIVISDGAPVDDITLKHNHKNLLEDHLKLVVGQIERAPNIELAAIGIGHDVSKFYQSSIRINDSEKLAEELFISLSDMFLNKAL